MKAIQRKGNVKRRGYFPHLVTLFLMIALKPNVLYGAAQNDLMQQEIKHVVVLMLENRSFDNLLGWLYSEEQPEQFIPSNQTLPFRAFPTMCSIYMRILSPILLEKRSIRVRRSKESPQWLGQS